MDKHQIKVAIILGGASSEREVSISSGKGVVEAVKKLGYKYVIIDPAYGLNQPNSEEIFFSQENFSPVNQKNYIDIINSEIFDDVDTAFIALHGTWGEDGTIQALLEMRGIKYTGSGVLPCSISMNKTFTKVMFKHYGVNTPNWLLIDTDNINLSETIEKIYSGLKFPCVVKPNNQGSAIGLSICNSSDQFTDAIKLAGKYSKEVLVEEYIDGYELTVGILDGHAFPPLEIKPKHDFYDYTCKYTHGMSEYIVPANFPEDVLNNLKHQTMIAYNSISCQSYARIDFRLNKELVPYCLEVNTLPGLTSTSLLPKTARAEGITYEELVDKIILNSLR